MKLTNEKTKVRGSVDVKLIGPDGAVKDTRYIPNLVVQNGKNYIATRILGTSNTANVSAISTVLSLTSCMTHMGVGTSTTSVAVSDTSLLTEVLIGGDIPAYFRANIQSATANTGVVTYVATFTTNNPQRTITSNTTAITEAGIFNSASSTGTLTGTMLCRTTFNPVNKGNDDTLQITWTITVS
jgi:hypothetical protein